MRASLAAAFLFAPVVATAQVETPPQTGPKKDGVELELELGFGACPECAFGDLGIALGARASYRWTSGIALGAYFTSINSNDDGSCGGYYYGGYSSDDCYEDELVMLFFGGEARYYPLSATTMSFDPYVAVGVGYGMGASRAGGPDLLEYSGLAFLPRFGAIVLLTESIAIGGSAGRSFVVGGAKCTDGDPAGLGDFSCGDDHAENPASWFTTLDAELKF